MALTIPLTISGVKGGTIIRLTKKQEYSRTVLEGTRDMVGRKGIKERFFQK
jgi:hypothetical protein